MTSHKQYTDMGLAPKDGTEIIGDYGDDGEHLIEWRDQRQCAGEEYYGEGWATTDECPAGGGLPRETPNGFRFNYDVNKRISYFTMINDSLGQYVEVHCNADDNPRDIMFKRYGSEWGFQYNTKEEAGVQRFGLTLKDTLKAQNH